jgi:thiamine-phosphate pyrophosphorylase
MKVKISGYYFITDEKLSKAGALRDIQAAVAAGVRVVQYRSKTSDTGKMQQEALALKKICRRVAFIINDRIDIALAVNADGVHVGQEDMPCPIARDLLGPKKIIGVTVHTVAQALQAEKDGANYLGVGPIFETATKKDAGEPTGIQLLREIKKQSKLPLAAIGGITLENAPSVIAAGADAICAISAVVTREDVEGEIGKFMKMFVK